MTRANRRAGLSAVLLRELPGTSPIRRLHAVTKLLCVTIITLVSVLFPSWPTLVITGALVLGAAIVARVPLSVVPRPPVWLWIFLGGTAALAVLGHSLTQYAQSILLTVELLAAAALLTWTTPLNEIGPAVATLGAPFRRFTVPVDEWAVAVTLCLRALPMLVEEFRILAAARRLRRRRLAPHDLVDLVTAVLAVALRRAAELGQAITARGGLSEPPPSTGARSRSDTVALGLTLVAAAATVVLGT